MVDQLAEIVIKLITQQVCYTFIQEYFRSWLYIGEINNKNIALEQNKIKLEQEKLMTPEDRKRIQNEKKAKYYSEKLTEWSDCKCSWLTPRFNRHVIENQLIAEMAMESPEKVESLRNVFAKSQCGQNQFREIQNFLANLH